MKKTAEEKENARIKREKEKAAVWTKKVEALQTRIPDHKRTIKCNCIYCGKEVELSILNVLPPSCLDCSNMYQTRIN